MTLLALGYQSVGRFCLLSSVTLGMLLAPMEPASAQSPPPSASYHVLLLYSESRLTPSVVSTDQALRSTLEARSPRPIVFYTEFLDLNSFHGGELQDDLVKLLGVKYRQRPIDLIVAQGQLTVSFALKNRRELFSNAPLVLVGVERSSFADLSSSTDVTGTWRQRGWGETLHLARRLQPGIRRAVVVVGASAGEQLWADAAHEQLQAHFGPVEISYLIGSSADDILKAIAALPDNAVVLLGPFLRDGAGRDFTTPAFLKQLLLVSRVPIYGLTDGIIGAGVVGGYVVSFEAHGKVAADLALRVLAGERPPPTTEGTTVPMFDDRQLTRWKINRRLLPEGSVVLFSERSLWERYRLYLIGGLGLIAVQGALIGLLLVQRTQRRRAQRSLAERLRFETLLSSLSAALASCPSAEIDREVNRGLRSIVEDLRTDRAALWSVADKAGEARLTHSWTRDGVPPVDAVIYEDQFPQIYSEIRRGQVVRLSIPSGSPDDSSADVRGLVKLGMVSTAVAPLVEGGVVKGGLSIGSVFQEHHWADELMPRLRLLADVFANALARQRAEQAAHRSAQDIRSLAGRLLTAEEDERRRIGRELHDGVNQGLASLSIALSALENEVSENLRQEVARLQVSSMELSAAIRDLSHELHPGILQYAGLSAALRSHCREFDHRHGIAVTYQSDEDLGDVPFDVALCLFRVTQEALKNTAMHAKAGQAWVTLSREASDLLLTIRDDGRGFDLAEVRGRGLGLISLEERVRLVGGSLTIDTKPQPGASIRVVVPLAQ